MAAKLTEESVRTAVREFWRMFAQHGSPEELMGFYSSASVVFGSAATRPEPGRLAAARRVREYLSAQTTVNLKLGAIEVFLLGESAALACYSMEFHATHVQTGMQGATKDEHLTNGRVSQLMALSPEGKLEILHEHISAPTRG